MDDIKKIGIKIEIAKDSNGDMYLNEYDERGNCIHIKFSDQLETWYDYDENNNKIHSKCNDILEIWFEYDKNGNCIRYVNQDKKETLCIYDDKNNLMRTRYSGGNDIIYERDSDGKLIHAIDTLDNSEIWYEYNEKGFYSQIRDSFGYYIKFYYEYY